jgi:hydroxymethylglutaryl-CoA lyase
MDSPIKLIECPRDAMQGWKNYIPTNIKIEYINSLLKVGFDTVDFGSFVSARAIPQMADSSEVLKGLALGNSNTRLLAIIANTRGADQASAYEQISCLGFPFSVSETFQLRNTNSTIEESLGRVKEIQNICLKMNKQLVIYISMAFGNPYGDLYSEEIVFDWVKKITDLGIQIISLADTVGLASAAQVFSITDCIIREFPRHQIGVHLHSKPDNWKSKIDAALQAGCRRFDGALKGIGGCPMADDQLVGNMDSELLIPYFQQLRLLPALDNEALQESVRLAGEIFR